VTSRTQSRRMVSSVTECDRGRELTGRWLRRIRLPTSVLQKNRIKQGPIHVSERYERRRTALDEHSRVRRHGQIFSEDLADKIAPRRESGQPVSEEEKAANGVALIEERIRWKREVIDTAVAVAAACEPGGPEPELLNGAAPVQALWRATRRELANELDADERRHQIAVRALIENGHDADGGADISPGAVTRNCAPSDCNGSVRTACRTGPPHTVRQVTWNDNSPHLDGGGCIVQGLGVFEDLRP